MKITFQLNGELTTVESPPLARFLDVLRDTLALTATKEGCGEGECGTCSILVDGEVVNACLLPAIQVFGRSVETLESLSDPAGPLSKLQESLLATDGAQCGICTPGMVMAGTAFLRQLKSTGAQANDQSIRQAIAGNLCRCTGYSKIIEGIKLAAIQDTPQESTHD